MKKIIQENFPEIGAKLKGPNVMDENKTKSGKSSWNFSTGNEEKNLPASRRRRKKKKSHKGSE